MSSTSDTHQQEARPPLEHDQAALHPTPVYATWGPEGATGLLLDAQGGFAILVDGEGFGVKLPPAELRRFGAYLFRIADQREPNRDLALLTPAGRA